MSLLTPIFLWLVPLAAIPLIIHLLNRRNLLTINFSTIRFFKLLERESIRKLKLLQLILLILRTIIIIFIILMITRPVIKGMFNIHNTGISSLHVIIIDDSFSMQGNKENIQKATHKILDQIPNNNQLIWINTNSGLQYKGIRENIPPIENFIKSSFLSGSFTNALNILKQNSLENFISRELYIITDAQQTSIGKLREYFSKLKSYYTYILIVPQLEDNLSITQIRIANEILLPGEHIDIEVDIQNNGTTDKKDKLLQLIINEMIMGQQLISIDSGENNTFIFKTALPKSGIYKGKIEIENDRRIEDNQFYFTLYIPNKHQVALIGESSESTYYIKESLNVLNKYGESYSISEYSSFHDDNLILYQQDVVFLFNPEILTTISDSKIEEYLYNGGHIIIFPGINTEYSGLSHLINITSDLPDDYTNLKIQSLTENSFQEINLNSIQINDIQALFVDNNGLDRNIRLFKYIALPLHPKYSKMQLNDGSSIWNRYDIQTGILDVFGYAVNLNWTNFPIKGSFLPFNHFLLYSHTANKEKLYHITGEKWEYILSNNYLNTSYHIQPDGGKIIVISDENNTLSIQSLNMPGYHMLQSDGLDIGQIAVNIPQDELYSQKIDIDEVRKYLPENILIIPTNKYKLSEIKQARIGTELWRYFLYATILLLILEMILSNAKKQQ